MGIKFNGSDVQAIYYNGFTIAKMMNNGSNVWTPPSNGTIVYGEFDAWPTSAFTTYTTPSGYQIVEAASIGSIGNNTIKSITQNSIAGFTMEIPELAGKDYKLNVKLYIAPYYRWASSGVIVQDSPTAGGIGIRYTPSGSSIGITPVKTIMYAGTHAYRNLTSTIDRYWSALSSVSYVTYRQWYDYEQRREGSTLYIKITNSVGTVLRDTVVENVVFNDEGTMLTIQTGAETNTSYVGQAKDLVLEIFE